MIDSQGCEILRVGKLFVIGIVRYDVYFQHKKYCLHRSFQVIRI